MKVAMISDWYPPKLGGVETLAHELSMYMDKRDDIEVEVITQDFSSMINFRDKVAREDGVKVRRLAGITGPFWKTYFHPELPFKIKDLFKREDYDVIHTHHLFTLLSVIATGVAHEMHPRRKCIVATNHTYHAKSDSPIFKLPKFFASFAGRPADRVFVGSDAAAKLAREVCNGNKVRKVEYGVPLEGFNPQKRSEEIREKYGDPENLILYAGRFGKRKGVKYLLRAFEKASKRIEDSILVLTGKGPKEKSYRRIIRNLGLEDSVIIGGFKPKKELQKLYASCDFAVFPSVRDESFGRVIPEAMASGKPYIATQIPGFDEVFEEGTGFLVPPKDPDSLAEKMIEISEDDNLKKRMGKKGRKIATQKYDWNKIVDKIVGIYNEVIS